MKTLSLVSLMLISLGAHSSEYDHGVKFLETCDSIRQKELAAGMIEREWPKVAMPPAFVPIHEFNSRPESTTWSRITYQCEAGRWDRIYYRRFASLKEADEYISKAALYYTKKFGEPPLYYDALPWYSKAVLWVVSSGRNFEIYKRQRSWNRPDHLLVISYEGFMPESWRGPTGWGVIISVMPPTRDAVLGANHSLQARRP